MNGICALCLRNEKLLESHIYPRHLYKKNRMIKKKFKKSVYEITINNIDPVNVISNPDWDGHKEYLLCSLCEKKLGIYENYFSEVFLGLNPPPNKYNIKIEDIQGRSHLFRRMTNLDYTKVKLYVLSILWKLSISKSMGSGLSLSVEQRERLRVMLNTNNAGSQAEYSINISAPRIFEKGNNELIIPFIQLVYGTNVFYSVIGNYVLAINLDDSFLPTNELQTTWTECQLKTNGELLIELAEPETWKFIIFQFTGLGEVFDKHPDKFIKKY